MFLPHELSWEACCRDVRKVKAALRSFDSVFGDPDAPQVNAKLRHSSQPASKSIEMSRYLGDSFEGFETPEKCEEMDLVLREGNFLLKEPGRGWIGSDSCAPGSGSSSAVLPGWLRYRSKHQNSRLDTWTRNNEIDAKTPPGCDRLSGGTSVTALPQTLNLLIRQYAM
jgi:hypothetical protein